ncbi:hypothetical protein [Winogradskya humida]
MRVKRLNAPVEVEPPRSGEDAGDCVACNTPDDSYIWVSERWRVRGMERPTGLPMVLILECRSHLDLGDLTNLLAAELGVMTVRLERAVRSLDGVARVHVNRWGDGSSHLHMWFLARPYGLLQLRGTFLSLWDDILPVIPEEKWLENLAHVAAWLAEFGGRAIAEPPHIHWQSPSTFSTSPAAVSEVAAEDGKTDAAERGSETDVSPSGYANSAHSSADASPTAAGTSVPAGTAGARETVGRVELGGRADVGGGKDVGGRKYVGGGADVVGGEDLDNRGEGGGAGILSAADDGAATTGVSEAGTPPELIGGEGLFGGAEESGVTETGGSAEVGRAFKGTGTAAGAESSGRLIPTQVGSRDAAGDAAADVSG